MGFIRMYIEDKHVRQYCSLHLSLATGGTRARTLATVATLLVLVVVPSAVFAQASITGLVRDSSGAVLPGVTVEASSPALIEKVRSAVTDGSGQYRIEDLRPGAYTITFSLTGFSTVRREGCRAG